MNFNKNYILISTFNNLESEFNLLKPSDMTSIIVEELSNIKGLVILCELDMNTKGEKIPRSELYGIKLAQDLRRKGLKLPITFISFLSREQITNSNLNRAIINTIGHSFLRLPCKAEDLINSIESQKALDDLELYDIQQNYCDNIGLVNSTLHSLNSNISNIEELDIKLRDSLKYIFKLFNQDSNRILLEYDESFKILSDENKNEAIRFVKDSCQDIVVNTNTNIQSKEFAINRWKLLLLDDEIDEKSKFIQELKSRNIDVICTKNVNSAEDEWCKDSRAYYPEIMVIVSDYRLEETKNGIKVHQKKQGYEFIKNFKNTHRPIKIVAYSSMSRRFLFESLKHYGIRSQVFSKIDFPIDDNKSISYICDEIIRLGNENWISINNMPDTAGWRDLKSSYIQIHTHPQKISIEKDISFKASNWIENFINNKETEEIKITANPYSPKTKDKVFLNSVDFKNTFSKINKAIEKLEEDNKIKLFKELLNEFRLSDPHIIEHVSSLDEKNIENVKPLFIARRIALWLCSQKNKTPNEIVELLIKKNVNSASEYINGIGLRLYDYPHGLTLEEQNWFQYEQGINLNIDKYWKQIEIIKKVIQDYFKDNDFFRNEIKDNKIIYTKSHKRKANFEEKEIINEEEVYFSNDLLPYIRNIVEIKALINYFNEVVLERSYKDSEYKTKLALFVKFTERIKGSIQYNEINGFNSLRKYIKQISNHKTDEKRLNEHFRLNEPWSLIKSVRSSENIKQIVFRIIEAIKNDTKNYKYESNNKLEEYLYPIFLEYSTLIKKGKKDLSEIINEVAIEYNKKRKEFLNSIFANVDIKNSNNEDEEDFSSEDTIDNLHYSSDLNSYDEELEELKDFSPEIINNVKNDKKEEVSIAFSYLMKKYDVKANSDNNDKVALFLKQDFYKFEPSISKLSNSSKFEFIAFIMGRTLPDEIYEKCSNEDDISILGEIGNSIIVGF